MNTWELCPKCKGEKIINKYGIDIPCDICDGKGIISSITGLPPQPIVFNISHPTKVLDADAVIEYNEKINYNLKYDRT